VIGFTTTNGWTTLIDDQIAGYQLPAIVPGEYHSFVGYRNGKWMRFGVNGFETYPAMLVTQP
jgi:hypothetical protein